MNKKWLILAGIIVFSALVWWIVSSTNEINRKIEQSAQNEETHVSETMEADNIEIVETNNGKKIWQLIATKAIYKKKNAKLTKIKGSFYNEEGKILLNFKAPSGQYIEKDRQISILDGAYVQHPEEKIIITSDKMFWSRESKDIKAEGHVIVNKEGFGTSYSDKAVFSSDFSKIKLEGNTYTELNYLGKK